jgi:hypothetical protein
MASDYDVAALTSSKSWESGTSATVEGTQDWAHAGAGAQERDANIGVVRPGSVWDWSFSADRSTLSLEGGAADEHTLAEDEFETAARYRTAQGDLYIADVAVQVAEGGHADWTDRLDASVVLVVHPRAAERHSLAYAVLATTQPFFFWPKIMPGLAYCYASDSLSLTLGIPFSALTWKASDHLTVSASVADSARLSVASEHGLWKFDALASWATASYRVVTDERGPLVTWEELGASGGVTVDPVPGLEIAIRAGRDASRRLIDESSHVLWNAGPAWTGSASLAASW